MKRIEIFFGEMGCGKSYNARRHAARTGAAFLEGDDLVSPEMAERVREFKLLERSMIEQLVHRLIEEIKLRAATVDHLVVAQALYIEEDRQLIDSELSIAGYEVTWNYVQTPPLRNARQLLTRPRGLRWVAYWLLNKPFFEVPLHLRPWQEPTNPA
jgi:gluconate kinase